MVNCKYFYQILFKLRFPGQTVASLLKNQYSTLRASALNYTCPAGAHTHRCCTCVHTVHTPHTHTCTCTCTEHMCAHTHIREARLLCVHRNAMYICMPQNERNQNGQCLYSPFSSHRELSKSGGYPNTPM